MNIFTMSVIIVFVCLTVLGILYDIAVKSRQGTKDSLEIFADFVIDQFFHLLKLGVIIAAAYLLEKLSHYFHEGRNWALFADNKALTVNSGDLFDAFDFCAILFTLHYSLRSLVNALRGI